MAGSLGSVMTGCEPADSRAEANPPPKIKPMRMHVGCQHGGTGKENLEYLARHGVFHLDGGSPKLIEGVGWDLDDSMAKKEACEKYGISLDAYHLPLSSAGIDKISTPNIILRTGRTVDPTRGNASYSTWNYEEALKQDKPKTVAGDVSIDTMYERITYFLDRVLPVAEEYNVRLANHIADPPAPVGFRGITRWNSPDVFEGIKKFAQLYDSPSHGFNHC